MVKERIPETDRGITGVPAVSNYDNFQRKMRDRGLMETNDIIKSGIVSGSVLEIGPGPGYLGLEWLNKTEKTRLVWLEISEDMQRISRKNADEYGFGDRIEYILSDATKGFPFEDERFDAVFTNGSLHEWAEPIRAFNEVDRVLKKGGRYYISDLKRNINFLLVSLMRMMTKKKLMKEGLITSVQAAYLKSEIEDLLQKSDLKNFAVSENLFGVIITGIKA